MALQVPSEVCRTRERNQACDLLQELFDLGSGACSVHDGKWGNNGEAIYYYSCEKMGEDQWRWL